MTDKKLAGKTALITGGSRGIGAAIARRFAQAGAKVAITYASSEDAANAVVADIEANGGAALAIKADATERGSGAGAVQQAIEHFSNIDILVANAGVFSVVPLQDTDDAAYERIFDVNVRAVIETVRAAAASMTEGNRILLISSVNADALIFPGLGLYGASKAALSSLAQGWARELGPRGITVNAIQPGPINTDMNPEDSEMAGAAKAIMPLGRFGRAEEVAALALFLAGDESAFITGARINIDGGFSI